MSYRPSQIYVLKRTVRVGQPRRRYRAWTVQLYLETLTELALAQSRELAILEQHLEVATGRIDYAEARQWREYLEDHRAELGFTQARIVAELEQLTGAVGNAWVNSDSGSPGVGDSAPMSESWQSGGG